MRIRNIKPEFWRSADVARLPRDLRLLYVGLWSYVDDNGVGVDDPVLIASDLFPREDDPIEVRDWVREGLQRLSGESRCLRYTVGGRAYIYVLNWKRHQKVHNPNKPRYPLPCGCVADHELCKPAGQEDAPPNSTETLGRPSGDSPETLGTGSEGQRVRGSEKKNKTPAPATPPRDDVEQLCTRLRDRVVANDVKASITEKWRSEARLLLDRDQRPFDQALRLVDWATAHHFWRTNVLSMPTFRKQYDRMLMQARSEHQQRSPAGGSSSTGSKRMDKVLAALDPGDPFLAQYTAEPTAQGHLTAIEGGLTA